MSLKFNFSKIEGFDWDQGNVDHIKKHGVTYKECEEIFFNTPLKVSIDKDHSKIEERLEAFGKTSNERLLFIVFTIRNNKIRVISGRDQNKKERREYEKV